MSETIAERLKKLIDSSAYSRTDIAAKAGITKQTLYKYENSIVTNIPSDKIEKLALILNTSPAYLMGWEETETLEKTEKDKLYELIDSLQLTDDQIKQVMIFIKTIKEIEAQEKEKHS